MIWHSLNFEYVIYYDRSNYNFFHWTFKYVPSTTNFFSENSPPIDVSRLESVDGSIIVEGTTLETIKFPQLQQIKPNNDGRSNVSKVFFFRICEKKLAS